MHFGMKVRITASKDGMYKTALNAVRYVFCEVARLELSIFQTNEMLSYAGVCYNFL